MNTCYIVRYTKKGWKELYHFEVLDWEIPDLPEYQVGYGLFGVAGSGSSDKNDTLNQRLLSDMKKFSGFIKKVKPGIIKVHTWKMDATDTIIKVDLRHPIPNDPLIMAGFPEKK
jgi:hypothetical protein